MKLLIRFALCLLVLLLLCLPLVSCNATAQDSANIIGRWRVVSFVTDDGTSAPIENELDMIFYSTGIGEAQVDGTTQYMFDYQLKSGKLLRTVTRSGQISELRETYDMSDDATTLTVYSPADSATITMQKVTSDVKVPVDLP